MRIRLRTIRLAAAFMVLLSPATRAATYYVSPTGSATNSGTPAAPWSMSKANSALQAGDVAVLLPGTYGTGIAPANSGSSYSKFITFVGSLAAPATTIVPSLNLGSGSTARHHVSVKGVQITSAITLKSPNDSLSYCMQTTGTFYINLGADDCVVANSTFNGDRLWIEGGANSETASTVNRDTLYNNTYNLYMDGFGAAFRISAVSQLYMRRCRMIATIGPNGDHGTFKMYGGRSGRFVDNLFDFTVLRTTACDECGQSYFRDYTVDNVFLRDTFNLRGPNYNSMFLTASGSYPGTNHANRYDSCVWRQEAPTGPGVLYWQNGAQSDTVVNCVVVSSSAIPIVMAGFKDNSLVSHNTFVYLGTNGHAGDTYQGGAFDWTGPSTVGDNIFYSPRGGQYAYGVSSTAISVGYSGNNNLLYNANSSSSSLMWGANATSPGSTGNACKNSSDECQSKYGDPLLVGGADVWTFDPHLKVGSPAIAAGSSGADIGALAYGTGGVDATAPARITDLAVSQTGDNNVLLGWTAPGDDGTIGIAAGYELRMSNVAITDANFASAGVIAISQQPLAPGSREQFTVNGLTPGTTYYFAIRAVDDAGNKALASNDATTKTLGSDTIAPAQIQDLNAGP